MYKEFHFFSLSKKLVLLSGHTISKVEKLLLKYLIALMFQSTL